MHGADSSNSNPSGVQGVCPAGWHLPSNADWEELREYLGEDAGSKLKEFGTAHWGGANSGATNEIGFTALPGGHIVKYDVESEEFHKLFRDFGIGASWWSTTIDIKDCNVGTPDPHTSVMEIFRGVDVNSDDILGGEAICNENYWWWGSKRAVRCVRD